MVEDHDRCGTRRVRQPLEMGGPGRSYGQSRHRRGVRTRHEGRVHRLGDLCQQRVQGVPYVRRQLLGQAERRAPVDGDRHRDVGPEAHGVFEGVEAVEQHGGVGEPVPQAHGIGTGHAGKPTCV